MYGLILRALQGYVLTTFGQTAWERILSRGCFPSTGFEPLLHYDSLLLDQVLARSAEELDRPVPAILEDLGTSIIAGQHCAAPRRLLRFGGAGFTDFLLSLEELPDRARLALPELDLPDLRLDEAGPGLYRLTARGGPMELVPLMTGVLTAMADDYGALVLIEPWLCAQGPALTIRLLEAQFAEARRFELSRAG